MFMRIKDILNEGKWYPEFGYHVSASKNRNNIKEHGIKPTSNGYAYIWDSQRMAEWFRKYQWDDRSQGRDIYKVKLSGLSLKKDSETKNMKQWSTEFKYDPSLMDFEDDGGGWMVKGGIPPENIVGIKENNDDGFNLFEGQVIKADVLIDEYDNDSTKKVTVVYNPSAVQLDNFMKKWHIARFLISENDFYIWNAYEAIHDQIYDALTLSNVSLGGSIIDGVIKLHNFEDDELIDIENKLKQNKNVMTAFKNNIKVENDEGELW